MAGLFFVKENFSCIKYFLDTLCCGRISDVLHIIITRIWESAGAQMAGNVKESVENETAWRSGAVCIWMRDDSDDLYSG